MISHNQFQTFLKNHEIKTRSLLSHPTSFLGLALLERRWSERLGNGHVRQGCRSLFGTRFVRLDCERLPDLCVGSSGDRVSNWVMVHLKAVNCDEFISWFNMFFDCILWITAGTVRKRKFDRVCECNWIAYDQGNLDMKWGDGSFEGISTTWEFK